MILLLGRYFTSIISITLHSKFSSLYPTFSYLHNTHEAEKIFKQKNTESLQRNCYTFNISPLAIILLFECNCSVRIVDSLIAVDAWRESPSDRYWDVAFYFSYFARSIYEPSNAGIYIRYMLADCFCSTYIYIYLCLDEIMFYNKVIYSNRFAYYILPLYVPYILFRFLFKISILWGRMINIQAIRCTAHRTAKNRYSRYSVTVRLSEWWLLNLQTVSCLI